MASPVTGSLAGIMSFLPDVQFGSDTIGNDEEDL